MEFLKVNRRRSLTRTHLAAGSDERRLYSQARKNREHISPHSPGGCIVKEVFLMRRFFFSTISFCNSPQSHSIDMSCLCLIPNFQSVVFAVGRILSSILFSYSLLLSYILFLAFSFTFSNSLIFLDRILSSMLFSYSLSHSLVSFGE